MKLTEEIDMDIPPVPLSNGNILCESNPSKKVSSTSMGSSSEENSKPHISKCVNGTRDDEHSHLNGNVSPINESAEEIGFEVESYSDLNSPSLTVGASNPEFSESNTEAKESSSLDLSDEEDGCDTTKLINECSSVDEEALLLDSSNVSEEFELRLSDDDDLNPESSHAKVSKTCDSEPGKDKTNGPTSRSSSSHVAGISQSGSETMESINVSNYLHLNLDPKEVVKKDEDCIKGEPGGGNNLGFDDQKSIIGDKIKTESTSEDSSFDIKTESIDIKMEVESSEEGCDSKPHTCPHQDIASNLDDKKIEMEENFDKSKVKLEVDTFIIVKKEDIIDDVIDKNVGLAFFTKEIKIEKVDTEESLSNAFAKKEHDGIKSVDEERDQTEQAAKSIDIICDVREVITENQASEKSGVPKSDMVAEISNSIDLNTVESISEEDFAGSSGKITSGTSNEERDRNLNSRPNISLQESPINCVSTIESGQSETGDLGKEISDKSALKDSSLPSENDESISKLKATEQSKQSSSTEICNVADVPLPLKESDDKNCSTASGSKICLVECKTQASTGESMKSSTESAEADKNLEESVCETHVATVKPKENESESICDPTTVSLSNANVACENNSRKDSCGDLLNTPESLTETSPEDTEHDGQEGMESPQIEISENIVSPLCLDNSDDMSESSDDDALATSEPFADAKDQSENESNEVSSLNKVSSSKRTSSCSMSPNYCDSTVLEISSLDKVDSQDCSSSVRKSHILKENNHDLFSRKRTLSHSEDDSCDSTKSKKLSSHPETVESSEASSSKCEADIGQKRPAEDISETESKKLRVSDELLSKKVGRDKIDNSNQKGRKQGEEIEQLRTLQKAATELGVPVSDPPQEPETFLDLAIERVVAKAAVASAPDVPIDLPFLRKLHKKEISQMSRSDLEELVLQKICEAITERSVVGELRLRCQALETCQERDKEKFNSLRKQMHELSLVMKKYLDQQKNNVPAPPIKVTRSVGLQVCQGIKMVHQQHCRSKGFPCAKSPLAPKVASIAPTRQVTPQKSPQQSTSTTSTTSNSSVSPRLRPLVNVVSSIDPPALVPTSAPNTPVVVSTPDNPRNSLPSPRVQAPHEGGLSPIRIASQMPVPPLQQIVGPRPRLNTPVSLLSTPAQVMNLQQAPRQLLPRMPASPSNVNRQNTSKIDVEVIDIDNEEPSKKTGALQTASQLNQKQVPNAVVSSSNGGMAVRLIAPAQVSQAGMTISSNFQRYIVPSQNMPQNVIITSASQANTIRGNVKLVMKSNNGNVVIPLHTSHGSAVSSSVMQLTPSTQAAVQQIFTNAGTSNKTNTVATVRQVQHSHLADTYHPAPLPVAPPVQNSNPAWKQIPPRPSLKIQHQNNGIVLSWNMVLGSIYADIESYQLYAYQEGTAPPSAGLWKKVGDVKALPLPMACTLTQFVEGHRYHFTVRAVDKHGRVGPFSQQGSIRLGN